MTGSLKSAYQHQDFAAYWNERAGLHGEPYKRHVLDPVLMKLAGELKGRSVLELGAGNGYLASAFINRGVTQLTLMDISEHNLRFAREKCSDPAVSFLTHDATMPWPVEDETFDVVYSNMMLNEVENIATPMQEAYRILKKGGCFVFSITHPAWDLFVYAQYLAGKPMWKITGLGGYFYRGMACYRMGEPGTAENPENNGRVFDIEHYQRPVSDYFSALRHAGFTVQDMIEPEINQALLQEKPGFKDYADHPVGLIFHSLKKG